VTEAQGHRPEQRAPFFLWDFDNEDQLTYAVSHPSQNPEILPGRPDVLNFAGLLATRDRSLSICDGAL